MEETRWRGVEEAGWREVERAEAGSGAWDGRDARGDTVGFGRRVGEMGRKLVDGGGKWSKVERSGT